ncbi:MAG: bifunctional phosphopantothenoylcysteine decarboxylase/phosphopantothenate--cysteine ligase CoaBC [Rickettsiales bacterium]
MSKRIIFGITGSIAASKSLKIAQLLKKSEFDIKIILSKSAPNFIDVADLKKHFPGNVFEYDSESKNNQENILHIELAKFADYILIAPASANMIAKLTYGLADCLLSSVCLASSASITIAPAMNRQMWNNKIVQHNIAFLSNKDFKIIDPAVGQQACGDFGKGRMQEPEDIVEIMNDLSAERTLIGKKIVITSGPTIEKIDPVRFISNFSSGKMGAALTQASLNKGANVILIANSNYEIYDSNLEFIKVSSTEEMHQAAISACKQADIFIGAAAVCDYRPDKYSKNKIKKDSEKINLRLKKNPDIISDVKRIFPNIFCAGFAGETDNLEDNAIKKLKRKNLDLIALNDVSDGTVFGSDQNALTIFTKNGDVVKVPKSKKTECAAKFLSVISKLQC